MKLLVTGSRNASPRMLGYARAVVVRAKELGWSVIVGEAHGVDAAVIQACDELEVEVEVYGAYGHMRHTSEHGANIPLLEASYLERDRIMAKKCDVCMAIWDGASRGTMITYQAAERLGKQVHLFK